MTDQDLMVPPGSGARTVGPLDRSMMRRAIGLAERGWGRVAPNPLVGAVVTRPGGHGGDGPPELADAIVGEGFHAEYGREHAEVLALEQAGEFCRDGTLYVTLEPCTHQGKTPPCVDLIIKRGIRRVVIACRDPNPEAEGGIRRLREAGVEVATGVESAAASRLNAAFLWSQRTGLPLVTIKLALSLDARIAERPGRRTQISGPEAGRWVHHLRAGQSAILVGRVTAEVDDPLLTVRGESARHPPVRIVLDPELRLSPGSRLVATAREAPLWVATAEGPSSARGEALVEAGARLIELPRPARHRLDLRALLRTLAAEGHTSLLVEGGGRVAGSFLAENLAQRMHLVYAPQLLGEAGVAAFQEATVSPENWSLVGHERLGDDVMLELETHALSAELAGRAGRS